MDSIDYSLSGDTAAYNGTWEIGPQTDGTNLYSLTAASVPAPMDTAGGLPASYGSAVLDIFKTGIGAWTATQQSQQLFDYKKFEATSGGLYQQGRTAQIPQAATGKASGTTMLIIAALVVFALMTHKG